MAAYDTLPAPLKSLVDGLWAVHTNSYDYAQRDEENEQPDAHYTRDEFVSQLFETRHPVVRVHPETGERSLVLGHFIKRFVGLTSHDSADLFALLAADPALLPDEWRGRAGEVPGSARAAAAVCDYIAGMTDRFARQEHARLTDLSVSARRGMLRPSRSRNRASLSGASGEMPRTVYPSRFSDSSDSLKSQACVVHPGVMAAG